MNVKPIRTDADLELANARIREIFQAEEGTPEDDELAVLLDLVEAYEARTVDMDSRTPCLPSNFAWSSKA